MPSAKPASPANLSSLGRSFGHFAADIKIAHSVFALPFAIAAFVIGHLSLPTWRQAVLLLVCMVTARSFAMGMNRFLDRSVDLANPRTRTRKIPRGDLTPRQGLTWSLSAGLLFIWAAFTLSPLAGYCSAPLLGILAVYSLMKHVSWLTHWYLGLCLGLAPIGVSVALNGRADAAVLLLGLAVALWTGGFDVLYALQDRLFDSAHKLHSFPSRFGSAATLWVSRCSFLLMVVTLLGAGLLAGRGGWYQAGVAAVAGLLIYEHVLVRDAYETGTSRHLNVAFFNMNAYVSVIYCAFTLLDAALSA